MQASGLIESRKLALAALPERERLRAWTQFIGSTTAEIRCRVTPGVPLHGTIRYSLLPQLAISDIDCSAQTVEITRAHLSRVEGDNIGLVLVEHGQVRVSHGGVSTLAAAGDAFLFAGDVPTRLDMTADTRQIALTLPGNRLADLIGEPAARAARFVARDHPSMAPLRQIIHGLREHAAALPFGAVASLGDALLQTMSVAVSPAGAHVRDADRLKAYHRIRTRDYIRQHLHEPALSVAAIARALGLSVSQLERVHADSGAPPGALLWQARLKAARVALADPRRAAGTIAEIAYAHGYASPAHFSRTFKAAYGMTPREFRAGLRQAQKREGLPGA